MADQFPQQQLLTMGRSVEALWMFEDLIRSDSYEVWLSYGDQIPELQEGFLFWGAGRYAYSIRESLPNRNFMAPGPHWLSGVPKDLLGRTVHSASFDQAVDRIQSPVRFKLAEMKHDSLLAGRYEPGELKDLLGILPELGSALVQWTESELQLNFEHRFFILDGEPLTGSPYLVDGVVFSKAMSWGRYGEAEAFARLAARELKASSPSSYVLDVAFDEHSESWIIVESNRAWSSGIYGADPFIVMEALKVSLTPSDWEWVPDEALSLYGTALKVADEHASGILKIELAPRAQD